LIDFLFIFLKHVAFLLLLVVARLLVVDRLVVLHGWALQEVAHFALLLVWVQLLHLEFLSVLLLSFSARLLFAFLNFTNILIHEFFVLILINDLVSFLLHVMVHVDLVVLFVVHAVVHLVEVLLGALHAWQVLLGLLLIPTVIGFVLLHLLLLMLIDKMIVQNGLWVAINLILIHLQLSFQ